MDLSTIALHSAITCVLKDIATPLSVQRFAVVGKYSESRPFVRHAGLLSNHTEIKGECVLSLNHVGPPIDNDKCDCHLVGQIGLTNEEIEAIEDWVATVQTQYTPLKILPFQQYTVSPHMVWVLSEEGRPLRQRFSCVGYVIEAYRAADVLLIDQRSLPLATRQDVEESYPELKRIMETPALSKRFGFKDLDDLGLSGDGPWRIALSGYLFHSTLRYVNGDLRSTPFAPSGVDQAYFPIREPQIDIK